MARANLAVPVLLLLLACCVPASGDMFPLTTGTDNGADSFVRSWEETTPFGGDSNLHIRGGGSFFEHVLLRFDLSSIPDTETVVSASLTLELSLKNTGGGSSGDPVLTLNGLAHDFFDAGSTWSEANVNYKTFADDSWSDNLTTLETIDFPTTRTAGQEFTFNSPSGSDWTTWLNSRNSDDLVTFVLTTNFSPHVWADSDAFYSKEGTGLAPTLELNTIPEPSTIAMWSLFGMLGIACWWRRRGKA